MIFRFHRPLALFLAVFAGLGMARAEGALSCTLPISVLPPVVEQTVVEQPWSLGQVQVGVYGMGNTNVDTLETYHAKHQPPQEFSSSAASVSYTYSGWWRARYRRLVITNGSGMRNAYQGNHDAGQLWIDLHDTDPDTHTLHPVIVNTNLDVSWIGIGYVFPWRIGGCRGESLLQARQLQANKLFLGSAVGDVNSTNYTGEMKTFSSAGCPAGSGWSADLSMSGNYGTHWHGEVDIEGLAGRLRWPALTVNDTYVVSPRVIEDPSGFLQDFWNASGVTWRQSLQIDLSPSYMAQLTYRGLTAISLFTENDGTRVASGIGVAWPLRGWTPAITLAPGAGRYSVGISSRYGFFTLTADRWCGSGQRYISTSFSLTPLKF